MNKKLLAVAVAGAVATPMLAHAQLEVYGRIGNEIQTQDQSFDQVRTYTITNRFSDGAADLIDAGHTAAAVAGATEADVVTALGTVVTPTLELNDDGDDNNVNRSSNDLDTYSSRLGLRYNRSIGNGMALHGQYEFDVISDRSNTDDGDAINDVRIASVGVSGSFGRFDLGNMWSAYYNHIGSRIDAMDMIYSTISQGPGRSSNTIKYSNSFGLVDFEADYRLLGDDTDESGQTEALTDGYGFGASIKPWRTLTLSVGYDRENQRDGLPAIEFTDGAATPTTVYTLAAVPETDITRTGIAASYVFRGVTIAAGYQTVDDSDRDIGETNSYFGSLSGAFDDQTSWLIGYAVGESVANFGAREADLANDIAARTNLSAEDSTELFVRVTRQVGSGLSIGYEGSFQTAGGLERRFDENGVDQTEAENRDPADTDILASDGYELTRHSVYLQLDF